MPSGMSLLFKFLGNELSYPCPATSFYSYKLSLLKQPLFCDGNVGILKLKVTKELRMAAMQMNKAKSYISSHCKKIKENN